MPKFGTKHGEREKVFSLSNFTGGLNLTKEAEHLPENELSLCRNMKVIKSGDSVTYKIRQGTKRLSTTALSGGADVKACFYYKNKDQYIVATDSTLYYLDGTGAPVSIGAIAGIPTFTEFDNALIIHDGGVTKYWDGVNFAGLDSDVVDEEIDTGDGATVLFSGTLDNAPITSGTLTITYTSTDLYTITSSGSTLSGDGSGTINLVTGVYSFTCDHAPDNTTSIEADYSISAGAPKSSGGFVRQQRLYVYGDSDHKARIWWTGPSTKTGWDTSSDGGYADVQLDDGYALMNGVVFYDYVFLQKENSLHLMLNYPGDTDFAVKPILANTGSISHKTTVFDGKMISFLSDGNWQVYGATDQYGDVQKVASLSGKFVDDAQQYSNTFAFSEYHVADNQLWLALYSDGASDFLDYVYIINLDGGGQLTQYEFAFKHSSFKWVDGRMLIGGRDGHLYEMLAVGEGGKDETSSYKTTTYLRTAFTDVGAPFNLKHCKRIHIEIASRQNLTGKMRLYKDRDYDYFKEETIGSISNYIYDTQSDEIYDQQSIYIWQEPAITSFLYRERFNFRELMVELLDLYGTENPEIVGVSVTCGVIGG